jgi:hypothetical protein
MGQRALLSTAKCHCVPPRSCTSPRAAALHRACRRMLPSAAAHHGVSWPRPPSATDRHQVHTPPRPTRSTVRGTEWHRGLRATPSVNFCMSGAQFSRATKHHRAPLCAALRAMPANTDLTLIRAGALQEPSQPILRCAETAARANAGRRAPPDATECHKVHTSSRHRAPPSGVTARCRLPPATAFHRVPLSATVRCKAPPSATIRATARRRVLPSAAECQMPPTDMSTARAPTSGAMHTKRYCALLRATTSCTSPTATARHRECNRRLPSFAARHGISCRVPPGATDRHQVPPRAHTARHLVPLSGVTACQRVPTRPTAYRRAPPTTEWHRGAPSGTEAPERHETFNLCIEWRPVLWSYRAPPGAAVRCAASHASQH